MSRRLRFLISSLAAVLAIAPARGDEAPKVVRVLTWNIWRGGDRAMDEQAPEAKLAKQRRVAEVIRASRADVVAMVETYGSGEAIARELGFHFHPRGTNVSILSRWPIRRDLSVYKPFHCVGALIEPPGGPPIAVYSVWVHYVDDVWTDPRSRDGRSAEKLVADDGPSRVEEVRAILDGAAAETAGTPGLPVIVAGDFNSNSHLDYTELARDQYGLVVPWPVTRAVAEAGYRDAYRVCNPVVDRGKDRTWSPRFPEQIQDRIDFVFWKGDAIFPLSATRIDEAPGVWPSDHAAVLVEFEAR
ncbi:endonuclease/exonuclease/phosphatase family protein [Planctomyces sp. SH-PL62]|uniref:endonuclease/exonuclease/phosphatase family protein n=1 Tax=Planctomyces sp. SH-PL62 TaxID=1636152 RepID=UPI00078CF8D0|nr:endonuclease/exonuclease/phosphatase family protein [Planctomyces sp. SH-PL62]AMV40124.1 Endonuclease/Exonuclease/phosphatase family protein [Planctomyces sp. SH-PL62]